MHQVQVDIQQWQSPRRRRHHVLVPNFFEKCAFFCHARKDSTENSSFLPQDSLTINDSIGCGWIRKLVYKPRDWQLPRFTYGKACGVCPARIPS